MDLGIDCTSAVDPSQLKAAGYDFICRYLCWEAGSWKVITPQEYTNYVNHGVEVFLNWEWYATDELSPGGAAAQATEAVRQARALGYPLGATIYFSADFDETPAQAATVAAYTSAASAVVRGAGYRYGTYGGFYTLQRLFNANLIDDGWQTSAWSGGQWEPRATLRQFAYNVTVAGVQADKNQRTGATYSSTFVKPKPPTPTPVPVAVPVPPGRMGNEMLIGKVAGNPACYVGDGVQCRDIVHVESLRALCAVTGDNASAVKEYSDLGALQDVLGLLVTPPPVVVAPVAPLS